MSCIPHWACDYKTVKPNPGVPSAHTSHKYNQVSSVVSSVLPGSPGGGCLDHLTFVDQALQFVKLVYFCYFL